MTVSTVVDHNDYTGNGVTTSFPYTFRIFKKTDLTVSIIDLSENITVLVLDTDYTVTNAGGYNGGNVVLTTPLANGWQISIARELEPTQETDLRNQGKFFAEVHEDAFDKLTMLIQHVGSMFRLALRKPSSIANWYDALNNYIRNLRDPRDPQDAATKNYVDTLANSNLSRTLRVPEPIPQLPDAATRANKIPAFDSSGNPIVVLPPSGSASDVLIELAKPTGAQKIGTNHRGTLQQDLDVIDIRTSGQPISALLSAGSDVEIDTQLSSTSVTQADTSVSGRRSGSIVATKGSIGLNLNADNQSANGLNITGAGDVTPTDTTPTYLLRYGDDKRGVAIFNSRFKLATMGVHIRKSFDAIVFNSRSEDMVYHPSLNAGGYAILTEGAENTLILGGSSKGTANDRHAIYISNDPTLRANKDVRIIGYRADYTGANAGGVDGTRNMPMINVRIVDGLIIDDCQLRGGGQGINVLNNLGVPQRVTITNNQLIDITKASADDGCTGIATSFTTGNNPIAGMLIANNQISIKRASGVTDGARKPIGISLSNVRQAVVSANIVSTPPDSYPVVLDSCRDVNISNLIGLPGNGTGTALELIRFEGASQDIRVSQLAFPNRPGAFSGLDNVTNLTVDFPRKLTIVSTNGTITSSDPNSLMSSVSATGTGEITIVFKTHVTTQALDNATVRGSRIAGPHVFANRSSKSLVCSIYTTSGSLVTLSTSTVGIDIILGS
ncbi:hypothetical protein [Enterobacter hormaechei]|uniref:hypothetical protein n=1 Tax=Enterobacter hormaechei TaxID=158836 RepID=UPI001F11AE28|nr:hypothetical protein [Enterobacter hormaechei]